jgi:hypothetical protein
MALSVSEWVRDNPFLVALIGVGLMALFLVAVFFRKFQIRRPSKKLRKDNYFNDEFSGSVIPGRKLIKRRVTQIWPLMVEENPDWEDYSGLGGWKIEPSLAEKMEADPLRKAIVYALFFEPADYTRALPDATFSHDTVRGFVSEAMFLFRREFTLAEVDVAVKEWLAKEAAAQAAAPDASASRWATRPVG